MCLLLKSWWNRNSLRGWHKGFKNLPFDPFTFLASPWPLGSQGQYSTHFYVPGCVVGGRWEAGGRLEGWYTHLLQGEFLHKPDSTLSRHCEVPTFIYAPLDLQIAKLSCIFFQNLKRRASCDTITFVLISYATSSSCSSREDAVPFFLLLNTHEVNWNF